MLHIVRPRVLEVRRQLGHGQIGRELDLGLKLLGLTLGEELPDEALVLGLRLVAHVAAEVDVAAVDDDPGLAARLMEPVGGDRLAPRHGDVP
jgi:hypothetical protein